MAGTMKKHDHEWGDSGHCVHCGIPGPHAEQGEVEVEAIGSWGRRPTFQAKVGTLGSSCVLVKGARRQGAKFHVQQRLEFCEEHRLNGMTKGCTPIWRTGIIWKIEGNRLFINLH